MGSYGAISTCDTSFERPLSPIGRQVTLDPPRSHPVTSGSKTETTRILYFLMTDLDSAYTIPYCTVLEFVHNGASFLRYFRSPSATLSSSPLKFSEKVTFGIFEKFF